jgi:hypothetical protein
MTKVHCSLGHHRPVLKRSSATYVREKTAYFPNPSQPVTEKWKLNVNKSNTLAIKLLDHPATAC